MRELVEYLAKELVDSPDEVVVTQSSSDTHPVIHLVVAESDMGKVIGRQGRVAQSMRSLLKVAAARRDVRATLEIG